MRSCFKYVQGELKNMYKGFLDQQRQKEDATEDFSPMHDIHNKDDNVSQQTGAFSKPSKPMVLLEYSDSDEEEQAKNEFFKQKGLDLSIPNINTSDQFEDYEDMKDRICDDSSWETNSDESPKVFKAQDELEPPSAMGSNDKFF